MDWFAERRRMLGSSNGKVKTFEEFISESSIVNTFYSHSKNVAIPVDSKDCTKYIITMGLIRNIMANIMSIDKVSNGIATNLFFYKEGNYSYNYNINLVAYDASSVIIDSMGDDVVGIVIDPLSLNTFSCDEILKSATVIDMSSKPLGEDSTISIQNPRSKGAGYVIAGWRRSGDIVTGAKIVQVINNISFEELAASGFTTDLLTGVHSDNSANGYWHVYCYGTDYVGWAFDPHGEAIVALSFDE